MDLARLAGGVLHHPDPAPAPIAFAAAELTAYLRRMFGTAPARRPHPGDSGVWLCLSPADGLPPGRALALPTGAEYAVRPAGETLVLAGATPRALLASVYALLEAAGCRWSPHGAEEEHVPGPTEAAIGLPTIVARPAFARRAYASDLATWHYTMPERLAERLPPDVAFVDRMAEAGATDLALWGLDLFGGGWCACSGCATLTPSDQALRVAQAVADRRGAAGRIFHLAYHDTLTPPRGRPGPQVWAEFAPRERCYAHALHDAACATNAPYSDALARHP